MSIDLIDLAESTQLTKVYVAETFCNQFLLTDSVTHMLIKIIIFASCHKVAMSLCNGLG